VTKVNQSEVTLENYSGTVESTHESIYKAIHAL